MTTADIVLAKYKAEHEKTRAKLRKLTSEILHAEHHWDIPAVQRTQRTFDYYHNYSLVCQGAIMALEEVINRDDGGHCPSHGAT